MSEYAIVTRSNEPVRVKSFETLPERDAYIDGFVSGLEMIWPDMDVRLILPCVHTYPMDLNLHPDFRERIENAVAEFRAVHEDGT